MKHLKTYEAHEEYREKSNYVEGDYVELKSREMKGQHRKGKIIKIVTHNAIYVKTKSYNSDKFITMELSPSNIKRKLTPEESEKYKISIETDKYNL